MENIPGRNVMKKTPKVIVVMPAHNAAKTVAASYHRLPKKFINEIILVDDASTDNTFHVAKKLPIRVFRNEINLGYGGNLKICLQKALDRGADIIIEYHPDNQYDPQTLPLFLEKAEHGFDFALGSRFIHPKEALRRQMPLIKFIANRSLTFIDQFVLGLELSEFHSGFRMYTRKLLRSVPFLQNSDDYLFSFEIIVQAVFFEFNVAEVQISCDYHPDMHTANLRKSTIYAIGTFKTLAQYVRSKFFRAPVGPFKKVLANTCPLCKQNITRLEAEIQDAVSKKKFSIYFCTPCQIGYTAPQPGNFAEFYPSTYYSHLKTTIYQLLQIRRPGIIKSLMSRGTILDIGCGDGALGNRFDEEKYTYSGIEASFAKSRNPRVKNVGIENLAEKPHSFELVSFWESFEHLGNPLLALKKSLRVLKKNGFLVIEIPNYTSWERTVFGNRWFHYDPPRHLFHYTPVGLTSLLANEGFTVLEKRTIFAPEYIPIGLAQSLLYRISPKLNVFAQNYDRQFAFFVPVLLIITAVLVAPISYLSYLFGGSPIQLVVARKR